MGHINSTSKNVTPAQESMAKRKSRYESKQCNSNLPSAPTVQYDHNLETVGDVPPVRSVHCYRFLSLTHQYQDVIFCIC